MKKFSNGQPSDYELKRWIGDFADKWDELLEPRVQQLQAGGAATYEDLRLALKMMLEVHRRDKCVEEACGCYGSMAANILRAAVKQEEGK